MKWYCLVALCFVWAIALAEEKKEEKKKDDKASVGTVIGIDLGTTYSW